LFEIGSFLLLEQLWQGLDKIRILMGDETTRRTKKEIVESLRKKSDASIEGEKERDDALTGLATGSGKTVVMAMLIAWQVINKLANKNQCVR
jgi:type I site-specific restriction endonuclease